MLLLASDLARALTSAAAVGGLLVTLRHATPRAGGLVAAVPINSMPALFWLSVEHGGGYAATAALGSLWGTGLTVLLGLTFARLANLWHASIAGLLACGAIGALAAFIWNAPAALTIATGLALVVLLIGQMRVASARRDAPAKQRRAGDTPTSMGIAAGMSLVVAELARHGGAQLCGLIATIPVVGVTALFIGHRQGGAARMLAVLEGYLTGMFAKAAFLGSLFLAWTAGAGSWAWLVALGGAGAALLAQRGVHAVRSPQPSR